MRLHEAIEAAMEATQFKSRDAFIGRAGMRKDVMYLRIPRGNLSAIFKGRVGINETKEAPATLNRLYICECDDWEVLPKNPTGVSGD